MSVELAGRLGTCSAHRGAHHPKTAAGQGCEAGQGSPWAMWVLWCGGGCGSRVRTEVRHGWRSPKPSGMEVCQPQMLAAPRRKIFLQSPYLKMEIHSQLWRCSSLRDGAPQNTRKNLPNPKAGNSNKEGDLPTLQMDISKTQGWRLTKLLTLRTGIHQPWQWLSGLSGFCEPQNPRTLTSLRTEILQTPRMEIPQPKNGETNPLQDRSPKT